jgi:hypothetical protein
MKFASTGSIDRLHAFHRSVSETNLYLRSNRKNPIFDLQPDSIIAGIILESASNFDKLVRIMNPPHMPPSTNYETLPLYPSRDYKVNFLSLSKHGTIEFRQHEGTMDPRRVCAWADFVLALVRKAIDFSDIDLLALSPATTPLTHLIDGKLIQALQVRE